MGNQLINIKYRDGAKILNYTKALKKYFIILIVL